MPAKGSVLSNLSSVFSLFCYLYICCFTALIFPSGIYVLLYLNAVLAWFLKTTAAAGKQEMVKAGFHCTEKGLNS